MTQVEPLPVIGVDPGSRWTAACLRVGDEPVYGWTLGPVDARGVVMPTALDDPDDLLAKARYFERISDLLERDIEQATTRYGRVGLAIEAIRIPPPARYGRSKLRLVDWLTPHCLVIALLTGFPDAVLVETNGHGAGLVAEYPAELGRKRPSWWGPNEARRGERQHERAAYDIAGAATSALALTRTES
jgi:hypothetical protein